MRNITGSPVDGENFFGRAPELTSLRQAVEAGNHVLLVGPRRIGKSSLLAELARRLAADGWTVVKIDVQDATDQAAFLDAIQKGLADSGVRLPLMTTVAGAIRGFRRVLRGTKISAGGVDVEVSDAAVPWEEAAGSLKGLIASLAAEGQRVLITLDELPIFLNKILHADGGLDGVRQVLDWLRSVRQACGTRLPWILCGSIGLDSFVERHQLFGCINELLPQPLGAFDDDTAARLLKHLAKTGGYGFEIGDEVARAMVDRVGWPIPYYLQLLFHALSDLPAARRTAGYPSLDDVDAACQTLLDPQHRGHFGHWDARLGDLLDADGQRNARSLLGRLCGEPRGCSRTALLNLLAGEHPHADPRQLDRQLCDLLELLERDGYLARQGDTYAFRSFLLRDFWRKRFAS